jgi:hypothetical protein
MKACIHVCMTTTTCCHEVIEVIIPVINCALSYSYSHSRRKRSTSLYQCQCHCHIQKSQKSKKKHRACQRALTVQD